QSRSAVSGMHHIEAVDPKARGGDLIGTPAVAVAVDPIAARELRLFDVQGPAAAFSYECRVERAKGSLRQVHLRHSSYIADEDGHVSSRRLDACERGSKIRADGTAEDNVALKEGDIRQGKRKAPGFPNGVSDVSGQQVDALHLQREGLSGQVNGTGKEPDVSD